MSVISMIDLNADSYKKITLNYFCTDSDRLREFCRRNRINEGESVLILGRSGRVRELIRDRGTYKVVLCEYNHKELSVQVGVLTHYERRMQGELRKRVEELRKAVQERLKRQMER